MAKEPVFQTSFISGELSPHMFDRVDMDVYSSGAAFLRNFIPLPHGPLTRRQGTQFLYESPGPSRLLPFSFNVEQSFMLEFTDKQMRVFYEDYIVMNVEGNAPFTLTTMYEEQDLPNLNYAQYRDWLYICDGRHEPVALKRYANNDWRLEGLVWTARPDEWGGTNWPSLITFFEQRAVYAGTRAQPQQMWFSRTGLPEDFTYNDGTGTGPDGKITILDDHAFTYTIFSTDANGIKWLQPGSTLIVGTSGAEYRVGSTVLGDALTPKNIKIVPQTYYGSSDVPTIKVGASIVFVPRSKTRVKSIEYSIQQEQYVASDMTMFSSHILNSGAKELTFQTAPDTYIWVITNDGELVGCTFEKQQKINAWHKHVTMGEFISICVLPSDGNDFIYVAVKRGDKYFIELLTDFTEAPLDINDAWYVDSGLKYDGPPIKDIVGLSHLEGEMVNILIDGWIHEPQVVVNGRVTLLQAGTRIQIGLPYKSDFISLVPQSTQRLTVGQTRRINEIMVALEDSLDFYYRAITRPADDNQIAYAGPTKIMNLAKEPFSGHRKLQVDSESALTQQMEVWTDRPVPLTIRGLLYYINPSGV